MASGRYLVFGYLNALGFSDQFLQLAEKVLLCLKRTQAKSGLKRSQDLLWLAGLSS